MYDAKNSDTSDMVQMLFSLRFKAQLRRTRPELTAGLEEAVASAAVNAGGKMSAGRRMQAALFDGKSLGFWLDMLVLVEAVVTALDAAGADVYGYSLVLGLAEREFPERLCRFLAEAGGGVFLDPAAREGLSPYAVLEGPEVWTAGRYSPAKAGRLGGAGFFRLKGLKSFASDSGKFFPLREAALRSLRQGGGASASPRRNVLLAGPAFSGKRGAVYRYCAELSGQAPPLVVRFGSPGAGGLAPLADAWTPQIRAFVEAAALPPRDSAPLPGSRLPPPELSRTSAPPDEELNGLWELLFRERLRDECGDFVLRNARRFFGLLLESYAAAAEKRGLAPLMVLENVHHAEARGADVLIEVYLGLDKTRRFLVLGTCGDKPNDTLFRKWERVFPRLVKLSAGDFTPFRMPEMPLELWEIAYAFLLLGRYFPAGLFPRLFEEEDKNPGMISRALSLLAALGLIDTPLDPRPRIKNFASQAEKALGGRAERVRALVRRRIAAWVEERRLSPCFRLLGILSELGGDAELGDELILQAITSDLAGETCGGIERARDTGLWESLAGRERAGAGMYVFETMRALLTGGEGEIRAAFGGPPPECGASPVFKAQILANLAAFHLGLRDTASALETVKEAILLSQGKHKLCLPQSYRLFALVHLSKQQTGETIDYLGFAMENAEKSGNYHELGIAAYYAAAAQFLFGNISRGVRLALRAREQALAAGRPDWADRASFLQGRFAFETGRYQEALDIFEGIRKNPFDGTSPEKERLLSAWAYRARVYFQNPLCPKPESGGGDAALFEVEAAYLSGNFRKTVELSGALSNPHAEENFLFTEQPDWRSGFAQCELLYFSRGELWDRMMCVYHSLALCRLSPSGGEEAMHNMQRILRNERLSEMDPWDAFYFYAWYRILEQTGAGQVDMNTAVSMAFKRLQRRASRIDDIETRRQYLSQPRWNSALSLAAREFKLI
jgi:hypothetical protein